MVPAVRLTDITFNRYINSRRVSFHVPESSAPCRPDPGVDWSVLKSGDIVRSPVALILDALNGGSARVMIRVDLANEHASDVEIRARAKRRVFPGALGVASLRNPGPGSHTLELKGDFRTSTPIAVADVDVCWLWEYRLNKGHWVRFDTTSHKLFLVLSLPCPPWDVEGGRSPWRRALTVACRWAKNESVVNECASAIARAVYDLAGQVIVDSQCDEQTIGNSEGACFIVDDIFFLSELIATANLEPGARAWFNCADCATSVALLGAAIGCNLRIARLGTSPCASGFRTNPVREFGEAHDGPTAYSFHEVVATVDAQNAPRDIWDAFLMVDTDPDPGNPPIVGGLPTAMPFRPSRRNGYLSRLVSSNSRPVVHHWLGGNGLRYPDYRPHGLGPATDPNRECLKQHYLQLTGGIRIRSDDSSAASALLSSLSQYIVPARTISLNYGDESSVLHYLVIRDPQGSRAVSTISFVSVARGAVGDLFLNLAADYRVPLEAIDVGEAGLHSPTSGEVLFARGNTVVQVISEKPGDALALARSIDGLLSLPPVP